MEGTVSACEAVWQCLNSSCVTRLFNGLLILVSALNFLEKFFGPSDRQIIFNSASQTRIIHSIIQSEVVRNYRHIDGDIYNRQRLN